MAHGLWPRRNFHPLLGAGRGTRVVRLGAHAVVPVGRRRRGKRRLLLDVHRWLLDDHARRVIVRRWVPPVTDTVPSTAPPSTVRLPTVQLRYRHRRASERTRGSAPPGREPRAPRSHRPSSADFFALIPRLHLPFGNHPRDDRHGFKHPDPSHRVHARTPGSIIEQGMCHRLDPGKRLNPCAACFILGRPGPTGTSTAASLSPERGRDTPWRSGVRSPERVRRRPPARHWPCTWPDAHIDDGRDHPPGRASGSARARRHRRSRRA